MAITSLDEYLGYVNPSFLRIRCYEEKEEVIGREATGFWANEKKEAENIAQAPGGISYQPSGNWR